MKKALGLLFVILFVFSSIGGAEKWYDAGKGNDGVVTVIDTDSFQERDFDSKSKIASVRIKRVFEGQPIHTKLAVLEYKISPVEKAKDGKIYFPNVLGMRIKTMENYDLQGKLLDKQDYSSRTEWVEVGENNDSLLPMIYWYLWKAYQLGGTKETIQFSN